MTRTVRVQTRWRDADAGPELEVRVLDESGGRVLARATCCLPSWRTADDDAPDLEAVEREVVATALRRAGAA